MAAVEVGAVSQREAAGRYRRWNQFAQLLKTRVHYWAQGPEEDLDFCCVMPIWTISFKEGDHVHANKSKCDFSNLEEIDF